MTRLFYPTTVWLLRGLVAVSIVALCVSYVSAVHAARDARQKVCAAELKAVQARNPFLERFLIPADSCLALELVSR